MLIGLLDLILIIYLITIYVNIICVTVNQMTLILDTVLLLRLDLVSLESNVIIFKRFWTYVRVIFRIYSPWSLKTGFLIPSRTNEFDNSPVFP